MIKLRVIEVKKKDLDPIQLTAYFSERTASKEDLEFIYKKIDSGIQPADLVRNAIKHYRKGVEEDSSDLVNNVDSFLDRLSNRLVEKLSGSKLSTAAEAETELEEEDVNKKAEESFNKRRNKLAKLGLARKKDN